MSDRKEDVCGSLETAGNPEKPDRNPEVTKLTKERKYG
jgi:hypothetical protein